MSSYNLSKLLLYIERKCLLFWYIQGYCCSILHPLDLSQILSQIIYIDWKSFPKYNQESFGCNILFLIALYFRWAGRDSNSHTLRRQILSLLRLPIPPPALGFNFTIIPYFFPKQQFFIIFAACPPVNFSGTQYWYGMR